MNRRATSAHSWRANRVRGCCWSAVALVDLGRAPAGHLRRVRRAVQGASSTAGSSRSSSPSSAAATSSRCRARSPSGSSTRSRVALNLGLRGRLRGALRSPASASAGTLEVLLARPISRRGVYLDAARRDGRCSSASRSPRRSLGTFAGAAATGRLDELGVERTCRCCGSTASLLFGAIAAIALAASVSFDRLTPALGCRPGVRARRRTSSRSSARCGRTPRASSRYSLFHYLDARRALTRVPDVRDFASSARGRRRSAIGYAWMRVPAAGSRRAGVGSGLQSRRVGRLGPRASHHQARSSAAVQRPTAASARLCVDALAPAAQQQPDDPGRGRAGPPSRRPARRNPRPCALVPQRPLSHARASR